jgi:protoporphyrinogen oxidase
VLDGHLQPYDAVLSTVPVPHTRELFAGLEGPYFDNLRSLEYLGVTVLTLRLDRPFSKYYWTNVSDARLPMSGVIESTNLNPLPALGGDAILYVPQYLSHTDPRYSLPDDVLFEQYCTALKLMNPAFDRSWIKGWWLHRERFTQPVCETGFSQRVPSMRTPIRNLLLTDSYQLNPNDRAISFSTDLGREAARLILEAD